MSAISLVDAFKNLQVEVGKIIQVETVDDEKAVECASTLAKVAIDYHRDVFTSRNDETFKQVLKERGIPLPIAYKAIHLLTRPELQLNHQLKRELAKTARIFFELVLCQCLVNKYSLYQSTHDELYAKFKEMVKTLPDEEVVCGFDLRCCRAALKNFASITTRAKEIAEGNATSVGVGVVVTVLSANAAPPYVNPTPLLGSLIELIRDIYKAKPEFWYCRLLPLKWCALEVGLQTVEQYKSIKHNEKTIKDELIQCATNANRAFYTCQVFKGIIDNKQVDLALRKELFDGNEISIVAFARKMPSSDLRNKFWKVRYLALEYLESLVPNPEFNNKESQKVIIQRMAKNHSHKLRNEKKAVRRKAYIACEKLLKHNGQKVLELMAEMQQEADLLLANQGEKNKRKEALEADILFLEENLKKNSRLKEHSKGAFLPSKKSLEASLKQAKAEYDSLLTESEELDDLRNYRNTLQQILDAGGLNGISIK